MKAANSNGTPIYPTDQKRAKDRISSGGWWLDQIDGKNSPWYISSGGAGELGSLPLAPLPPKNAVLIDKPSGWEVPAIWLFISCAICKKGADENLIYGCLGWGFEVDGNSKITKIYLGHADKPDQNWKEAVKNFQKQIGEKPEK
jgi:hypothetical protein